MSKEIATAWLTGAKENKVISVEQLVKDIKKYVEKQPDDFRLIFMIDEVGQYVGADTDLLLNLQSVVEQIGTICQGKVWVMCTGQDAIDEIIKVRPDDFSRIQARFSTYLSLSSSSVDEVIQKRILKKKPDVKSMLEEQYGQNVYALSNLITFDHAPMAKQGFGGASEFAENFPFVPYQFNTMQDVFSEIRKHGNSGKHLSGGERSMLSGFQEAAQKIQKRNESALVPFYYFYDTVRGFLDSNISKVIIRCQKLAEKGKGVESDDVDVLKLLYLIRYLGDIRSNINNIVVLMLDDIFANKINLRNRVERSLTRLQRENFISRNGDTYHFLTDEEQEIQRAILHTNVDTASIIKKIGDTIVSDIYGKSKFQYKDSSFFFDKMVDNTYVSANTGAMCLQFLTNASDMSAKDKIYLMNQSRERAIVVLDDKPYYTLIENKLKVDLYIKQHNLQQLHESRQDIIHARMSEAQNDIISATELLKDAIISAKFYVNGDEFDPKSGDAKAKLDQVLEHLAHSIYEKYDLIVEHVESDKELGRILSGESQSSDSPYLNEGAAEEITNYLKLRAERYVSTSMFDVQSCFKGIPYGWKEIDIAAVVAWLLREQKVTIQFGGEKILPSNRKLCDMLRKQSEVKKTSIAIRENILANKITEARNFLREYFDINDVANDEDGLIADIVKKFMEQELHYKDLESHYENGRNYPDKDLILHALDLINSILLQQKDNIALIDCLLKKKDDLYNSKEDLQDLESFFKTQIRTFDKAYELEEVLRVDEENLLTENEAFESLEKIRRLMNCQSGKFEYRRIPELNSLMATLSSGHDNLMAKKRSELEKIIRQCRAEIHQATGGDPKLDEIVAQADLYYDQKMDQIKEVKTLIDLDGLENQMWRYMDQVCNQIATMLAPPTPSEPKNPTSEETPTPPKKICTMYRQIAFPTKTLYSEEEIDTYLAEQKAKMMKALKAYDAIKIE